MTRRDSSPQRGARRPGEAAERVVLLVIAHCPNSAASAAVLSDALVVSGHPEATFTTVVLDSLEEAESHKFIGSPSIHVDGRDILPVEGAPAAVACRTYVHADGSRRGVPETAALARALTTALD
jgi:hypothetical protein